MDREIQQVYSETISIFNLHKYLQSFHMASLLFLLTRLILAVLPVLLAA